MFSFDQKQLGSTLWLFSLYVLCSTVKTLSDVSLVCILSLSFSLLWATHMHFLGRDFFFLQATAIMLMGNDNRPSFLGWWPPSLKRSGGGGGRSLLCSNLMCVKDDFFAHFFFVKSIPSLSLWLLIGQRKYLLCTKKVTFSSF